MRRRWQQWRPPVEIVRPTIAEKKFFTQFGFPCRIEKELGRDVLQVEDHLTP